LLMDADSLRLSMDANSEPESVRDFADSMACMEEACKALCIDLIKASKIARVQALLKKMEALTIEFGTFKKDYVCAINAAGIGHALIPNARTVKGTSKGEGPTAKRLRMPEKGDG